MIGDLLSFPFLLKKKVPKRHGHFLNPVTRLQGLMTIHQGVVASTSAGGPAAGLQLGSTFGPF